MKVVVEVKGGTVQQVWVSDQNIIVRVYDWDDIEPENKRYYEGRLDQETETMTTQEVDYP